MKSPTEQIQRPLGGTDLQVAPVSLGTWPMAGTTTLDVNDADSLDTIRACFDLGINFIDTAYCYGPNGESENLLRQALAERRDEIVLATKCGIHYDDAGVQTQDARPETIRTECDESLRRLGTDRVELYYLHSPDPAVPMAESAGAIRDLIAAGKVRYAGASNCQLRSARGIPCSLPAHRGAIAVQHVAARHRAANGSLVPRAEISVVVYWALMKGLLAGRLTRQEQLATDDSRRNYPMYQGEEWEKNQAFVAQIREVAEACDRTVAQVVVNWTIHQPGITVALCGAKRPWQIEETAAAMRWQLAPEQNEKIAAAITTRGKAAAKRLFQ